MRDLLGESTGKFLCAEENEENRVNKDMTGFFSCRLCDVCIYVTVHS